MRVVTREKVEVFIGVIDQPCDILVRKGGECQLLPYLLAGRAFEANRFINSTVNFSHPIEPSYHFRDPASAEFNRCAPQTGISVEHAIEDQHRQKGFRRLMHHSSIFGANIFAAAHPIFDGCATIVAPGLQGLQGRAAHMQYKGGAGFGQ